MLLKLSTRRNPARTGLDRTGLDWTGLDARWLDWLGPAPPGFEPRTFGSKAGRATLQPLGRGRRAPGTGLDWAGLGWAGLDWPGWTALGWTGLAWTGPDWIGLDWTGPDWTDWTGLDWPGLDWADPKPLLAQGATRPGKARQGWAGPAGVRTPNFWFQGWARYASTAGPWQKGWSPGG